MNITKTTTISDNNLRDITRQVMDGILFLHQNNCTHNDLKPSNILLTRDGTVKIADFGVSGLGRVRLDSAGTPAFTAPEVVSGYAQMDKLPTSFLLEPQSFASSSIGHRLLAGEHRRTKNCLICMNKSNTPRCNFQQNVTVS